MKLIVPYVGRLQDFDARLIRLAAFLGVSHETLALERGAEPVEFLEKTLPAHGSCFVVNPKVIQDWIGHDGLSDRWVSSLLSRFSHLLVHGLRVDAFDNALVAVLSRGKLESVEAIDGEPLAYVVANDSTPVCEAFAGLSFGRANPANDHVFRTIGGDPAVQPLISINRQPFMVRVRLEGAEILFVASEDVADLNSEFSDADLPEYFSRLLPHAMALRHAAGDECWRPREAHACVIVDDPLLRESYGFLDFKSLLRLAEEHRFHTAIAFIPHNFRRNSRRITRLFQENSSCLSICFHGNDHTEAELAATDVTFLNTVLRIAEDRIESHHRLTGLPCDKVMVFPQGNFSVEAMEVLKAHNFQAAVNTVLHPTAQPVRLTLGEHARPAVLRYGGFPLFIRQSIRQTRSQNIAFNLFFGRPVLIGEHHDLFQHPEELVEIVARINAMAPGIHWSNLTAVVGNSILTRRAPDGTQIVLAYSGSVRVANDSDAIQRYSVRWDDPCDGAPIEQVLVNGTPSDDFEINDAGPRLSVEIAPHCAQTFSLVHRNVHHAAAETLGLAWNVRAFLRRRLSEIRDNHLSKNQQLLAAATALKRRFLR